MPGVRHAIRHAEHLAEAAIDDQQFAGLVEHQQALQHVVQRGVEAVAVRMQSAGAAFALLGACARSLGGL